MWSKGSKRLPKSWYNEHFESFNLQYYLRWKRSWCFIFNFVLTEGIFGTTHVSNSSNILIHSIVLGQLDQILLKKLVALHFDSRNKFRIRLISKYSRHKYCRNKKYSSKDYFMTTNTELSAEQMAEKMKHHIILYSFISKVMVKIMSRYGVYNAL